MITDLAIKMINRADQDSLPPEHVLRTRAVAFDEAAKGFYGEPQTVDIKVFMGAWIRARKTWSVYSGEPFL